MIKATKEVILVEKGTKDINSGQGRLTTIAERILSEIKTYEMNIE